MKFLRGNEWQWRLLRTIVQGVIGVLVANLDLIVGWLNISAAVKPIIVALCMAILSPIMAEIGRANEKDPEEKELLPFEDSDNIQP